LDRFWWCVVNIASRSEAYPERILPPHKIKHAFPQ
jgi:hypothetical protein